MTDGGYKVYRNVCPRNCYDTCSMLSYVQNGKLEKVEGDPLQGYTQGRLCTKGYAYTEYVYSPDRLRYPLYQYPRGSGHWERISWDQALEMIAGKMIELNRRYGSNLSLAYNKYSGNIGLLHYAIEGMFNSLGAHTKPFGDACLAAGKDALHYDLGKALSPDPESMAQAGLIMIWGANPAWTAVHQLDFIKQARDRGAKLVVIDPLFTPIAAKADLFIQIRPGTDGLLALTLARMMIERKQYDRKFAENHLFGWESFLSYLRDKISINETSEVTGVSFQAMEKLASLYASHRPCAHWAGFGMQRSSNGGQNIRSISALAAITGNLGQKGGGMFYLHPSEDLFPRNLLKYARPLADRKKDREADINNFAEKLLSFDKPPVKFLWIASRNPLSQDQDLNKWQELLRTLELVVTVDLFMTKTAQMSDVVLPAASHFEEVDLNISYWHHWLALNEKAIPSYYEAKSDLEIARMLTRRLKEISPGFSNFPDELTAEDWLAKEFTFQVYAAYGLSSWQELKDGPHKLRAEIPWLDRKFRTCSTKFELYSNEAKKDNLPALPRFSRPQTKGDYPLRLITPQNPYRIHSQYNALSWLSGEYDNVLQINPKDAAQRELAEGDWVRVYNAEGEIIKKVQLSNSVPPGVVVAFQGGNNPANLLIARTAADMGMKRSGSRNAAFYDTYVDCVQGRR
jgi:anaerobic selenocysteine-containing dehydrogenase